MAKQNIDALDMQRAKKFLRTIAEEPFLCIVVTDEEDPQVQIFSKAISPEHVRRIKDALEQVQKESANG